MTNAIKYNRMGCVMLPCVVAGDTVRITVAGIGLVVCKRLVEAMDGRIDYDSIVGVGSRFWIELPLAASADDVSTTPPVEAKEKGPDNSGPAYGRVLYIEDSPININIAGQCRSRHGGRLLRLFEQAI